MKKLNEIWRSFNIISDVDLRDFPEVTDSGAVGGSLAANTWL